MDQPRQCSIHLLQRFVGIMTRCSGDHCPGARIAMLPPLGPELRLFGSLRLLFLIQLVVRQRATRKRQPLKARLQALDLRTNALNIAAQQPDAVINLHSQRLLVCLLGSDLRAQLLDPGSAPGNLNIDLYTLELVQEGW